MWRVKELAPVNLPSSISQEIRESLGKMGTGVRIRSLQKTVLFGTEGFCERS